MRERLEVLAVVLTVALHFVLGEGGARACFIGLSLGCWSGYVWRSLRREPGLAAHWGFVGCGLAPTSRWTMLLLASGALAIGGLALWRGSLVLHGGMLPLLLLYPIWGLCQQFLVLGILVNFLSARPGFGSPWAVTPCAAALFALVHWPEPRLMLATGLLGAGLTAVYLRFRNLWPLAACHGWLGVLFYYWILDRDPWTDLLDSLR
ncbi:MAG: type II CAAX prenyl endopeptidase Rce1 family protein [Planctomycetota bacterium]